MARNESLPPARIIYLTAGFIKGELNFGEHQELANWKNESLQNRLLFDELTNEDNRSVAVKRMQQFYTEDSLLRVKLRIEGANVKAAKRIKTYWYAAAVLLVVGMSLLFNRKPSTAQLLTIHVPYGKLKQITLPDSSKAWLNAGTTIQYPEHFTGSGRHILLKEGQAFFEVRHDQSHPFVITARGVNVTVLGTSFEVKAFADEKENKVTVSSGKVGVIALGSTQAAAMLLPNEQAIINSVSKKVTIHKVNAADIASWRENKLVFESEPFPNVIHALERKYNVRISVQNKELLKLKITLRLDSQPLVNVLGVLSFANNFTYSQSHEQLIVIR